MMKLSIGTAQFGLDYGTASVYKQNTKEESERILDTAYNNGIRHIDTAYEYGNSEEIIGKISNDRFDILTKTISSLSIMGPESIIPNLKQSLAKLNVDSVSGLLVHNSEDLLGPYGDDIFYNLCKAKDMGLAESIGVSTYDPLHANLISEKYNIDILHIPYNIIDQRFTHTIKKLKSKNISIYIRSVFLQGVLLKSPEILPEHLKKCIQIKKIQHVADNKNISVLQLLLGYVKSTNYEYIDKIIVGVHRAKQLQEIISIFNEPFAHDIDFSQFATNDLNIINPRNWNINKPLV